MVRVKNVWFRNINWMEFSGLLVGAGLASIAIILVTVLVTTLRFQGYFDEEYQLYCYFDKGLGLRKGTKVQVNGVEVGRVSEISLTPEGRVKLQFTIKTEYRQWITSTSEVYATRDQNLIAERIINIAQGKKAGPILEDGDVLYAGQAQDIETVLESVIQLLNRIEKIAMAADTLIQLSMDTNSTIGALIGSKVLYDRIGGQISKIDNITSRTGGILVSVEKHLPVILGRTDTLTQDVVQIGENLFVISDRALSLMSTLDTTVYSLNLMMGDLHKLARSANSLLVDGEEKLQRVDDLVTGVSKFWFLKDKIPTKDSVPVLSNEPW